MSWIFVRHALEMIFGNFTNALKVSVGPTLLLFAAGYVVFLMNDLSQSDLVQLQNGGIPVDSERVGLVFGVLALFLIGWFLFSWVAVSWHRFILLEEYPGFLPAFRASEVFAYMGKTIVLFLLMFVTALVGAFVLSLLSILGPRAAELGGLALGFVISYLWFRISLGLPAAAIGQSMKVGESLERTKPVAGQIAGMVLILVGLNFALGLVQNHILAGLPYIGIVFSVCVDWLTFMLGFSILTTLYGYLVEGRSLNG